MSIEFTQVIEMGKIVVVLKKNLKKREKYPPEGLILAFFLCYYAINEQVRDFA